MNNILNVLARGAMSLSFERQFTTFDYEPLPLELKKPRTPMEIMRSAWEEVGSRMWEAVGEVKKEYGH